MEIDTRTHRFCTAGEATRRRYPEIDRPPDASRPGSGQLADIKSQAVSVCEAVVGPGPPKALQGLHVLGWESLLPISGFISEHVIPVLGVDRAIQQATLTDLLRIVVLVCVICRVTWDP